MENQKNERALPVEPMHDEDRAVGAVRPRARHAHEQELPPLHEGGHQIGNQAAGAAGKNREEATSQAEKASTKVSRARGPAEKGNLQRLRVERMMSKAELARRAGVSTLTIDRVERGLSCRMDTKRKILEALGLKPSDRDKVFGPEQAWLGAGGTTGPHKETKDHRSARNADERPQDEPDESEDLEE